MRYLSVVLLCITTVIKGSISDVQLKYNSINVNMFPCEYECQKAQTFGAGVFAVSIQGDIAYDPEMVIDVEKLIKHYQKIHSPYSIISNYNATIGYGITELSDIFVTQSFHKDLLHKYPTVKGPGKCAVAFKQRIPKKISTLLDYTVVTQISIPYNSSNDQYFIRKSYFLDKNSSMDSEFINNVGFYSSGKPELLVKGIYSLNKNKFQIHANLGAIFTLSNNIDHVFSGATGFVIQPSDYTSFSSNVYYQPQLNTIFKNIGSINNPIHISFAGTIKAVKGVRITIGGVLKLAKEKKVSYFNKKNNMILRCRHIEPLWKTFIHLDWIDGKGFIDSDSDLITDRDDTCPNDAEDIDNFNDNDGCPDPDNDDDKIVDSLDSCPDKKEDKDGFNDNDGCPDLDNDGDNIVDSLDMCPNDKEDKDGFNDNDGCPDPDNDNDNITDTIDHCPGMAEDKDSYKDDDGCPDYDNDMDNVPDSSDQCPDDPGSKSNKGCPVEKAKKIKFGRLILPGVNFKNETDTFIEGSYDEIDRLYLSLCDWPEVRIEIQCHTDNTISLKRSLLISQKRADAVFNYLVKKGINPDRMETVGKGRRYPIADNNILKGRELNNRVEIHRIK